MAPAQAAGAKGRRAFCNWDEDTVTMAVEAARNCLADCAAPSVESIYLASTSFPFADMQNSAVVAAALRLSGQLKSTDVGGSQRAGVSALLNALSRGHESALVIAAERPRARPASAQEMQYGAGAAAFSLGSDEVAANLIASSSSTALFVDHFRASGAAHDYFWEERWIREEGYLKIVVQTINAALARAGLKGASINHFILAAPTSSIAGNVARAVGLNPESVESALDDECGYAGTAHAPLMLTNTLDRAQPGETILLVNFGQGCDALILETTSLVAKRRPPTPTTHFLSAGKSDPSYLRMASFYGEISPDFGMRAERDAKTALSEQYRSSGQIYGFVAGKCSACAQVQFPQLAYCVGCQAPASKLEPLCLAEKSAAVVTHTADWLSYHPAPPLYVGFAQFDGGARLLMEFVDVDPASFGVGTALRMVFRIKERDEARGYSRYFWKAAAITPHTESN